MSPRAAGAALIVLSLAAGALAGAGISHPVWGIPAAILLAFASVGMLAGLLWLFRRSWSDKTWPPAPAARSDVDRGRRTALILGIALLSFVPPFIALAVWGVVQSDQGDEGGGFLLFVGFYVVAYAIGGVTLVRFGRSTPDGPGADDTDAPGMDDPPVTDSDGWQRLGRVDWRLVTLISGPFWILGLIFPVQLIRPFVHDPVWAVLASLGAIALVVAITLVVGRARTPSVWVDAEGERVRSGKHILSWHDLVAAELLVASFWIGTRRTIILVLKTELDRRRVPLVIRRRGARGLTRRETEIAVRMIEAAPIALPIAKEDPTGKFVRFNFPGYLSKDEALEVVRRPPADGDPLPTGPR